MNLFRNCSRTGKFEQLFINIATIFNFLNSSTVAESVLLVFDDGYHRTQRFWPPVYTLDVAVKSAIHLSPTDLSSSFFTSTMLVYPRSYSSSPPPPPWAIVYSQFVATLVVNSTHASDSLDFWLHDGRRWQKEASCLFRSTPCTLLCDVVGFNSIPFLIYERIHFA